MDSFNEEIGADDHSIEAAFYPEALENLTEGVSKKDIIKLVWKEYLPTAGMVVVSTACIIGSHAIDLKRSAALASLYALSVSDLNEFKKKTQELIGEKKTREIKDGIAKDRITKNPKSKNEVIITGNGDSLCYDAYSGRYFMSNIEKIRKVENDCNQMLLSNMWVSLNEVYYELGLDTIKMGDDIGWNADNFLDFDFSSQLTDDGRPCLVVDYRVGPRHGYQNLY